MNGLLIVGWVLLVLNVALGLLNAVIFFVTFNPLNLVFIINILGAYWSWKTIEDARW